MAQYETLGALQAKVSEMGSKIFDGQLSHDDTVAIIDQNSGIISTIQDIRVEVHSDTGTRTIWFTIEEV